MPETTHPLNVAAILMARDSKIVFITTIVLLVILAILIALTKYMKSDDEGLGQQFEQVDIQDSIDGTLLPLNAACAATNEIIVGLFDEGFVMYSVGSSEDIKGNTFMMSFWKKLALKGHTVVVTSSFEKRDITCIISITQNVQDVEFDGQSVAPSIY